MINTATDSGPSVAGRDAIGADEFAALDTHRRAANYLGAAQIDLRENVLLEELLRPEHIMPRLLGHRETVPGVYSALSSSGQCVMDSCSSGSIVSHPDAARAARRGPERAYYIA